MSQILLKDLKVGDEVWMANSYSSGKDLYKIERLTKSQIIFRIGISEARFNRETGVRIGVNWRARSTIFPVTPDMRLTLVEDITRRRLWEKLDSIAERLQGHRRILSRGYRQAPVDKLSSVLDAMGELLVQCDALGTRQ